MVVLSISGPFLAFNVGHMLREMSPLQGALLIFVIALVISGIIYLVYCLKAMSGSGTSVADERAEMQRKMASKRDELMEKRAHLEAQIPSGPIEDHNLPQARLQIRNRLQEIPSDREFKIGKVSDNDLAMAELGVSRHHAKIRPEKLGYILYDLGSSRGTFVNNDKIEKKILREGDKIKIGPETLIFYLKKPGGPASSA